MLSGAGRRTLSNWARRRRTRTRDYAPRIRRRTADTLADQLNHDLTHRMLAGLVGTSAQTQGPVVTRDDHGTLTSAQVTGHFLDRLPTICGSPVSSSNAESLTATE